MTDTSHTPQAPAPPGPTFRALSVEECVTHLAGCQIGRLAVMIDHYPQVFCVNYRLDGDAIVFRTQEGTHVHAADHQCVGFEVDYIDHIRHTGWTVLVQGAADDITDRPEGSSTDRARMLDLRPWVPGEHPRIIRIIPREITGRELSARDLIWSTDDRGYL